MAEPVSLRTPRLLLRPFGRDDADDVVAYAADPEFARYLPLIPQPYARADAVAFIEDCLALDRALHAVWAIEQGGRAIGAINPRVEPDQQRASLGYGIARRAWGQGITTEAARAVVGWGFGALGVQRIYATADARNTGSRRVMEKLGMMHEGTLRRHRSARDGPSDQVVYGLLRAEWDSRAG